MVTLDELKKAIETVLEYNWNDELEDYIDQPEGREQHIFVTLAKLDGFLYGHEKTADEFANEVTKAESGPPYDAATATGMYDHDDGC